MTVSYTVVMPLLKTQQRALREWISEAGFRPSAFAFSDEDLQIIEFNENSNWWFNFEGRPDNFQVRYRPGEQMVEDMVGTGGPFNNVKPHFVKWLKCLKKELRESDLAGAGDEAPRWIANELPSRYEDVCKEIEQLAQERDLMGRMARLLWQTGHPLNEAVRDAFIAFGCHAEMTEPGATYDVTVTLATGQRRLLIEVTGIEGNIQKKSNKITQLLSAAQEVAEEHDRIILAVNAYRDRAVGERSELEIVTPNALKLLVRVGATVITTASVFETWKLSLANLANIEVSRRWVDALYAAPPGLFEGAQ